MRECLAACNACADACGNCFAHMVGQSSGNDCPRCCIECAAICRLCADSMARNGPFSKELLPRDLTYLARPRPGGITGRPAR
jgi:hypothetical protein